MIRRLSVLMLVAGLGVPAIASACSCTSWSPEGRAQMMRPWSERPAIFVGHALEVDGVSDSTRQQLVRLVTEFSWRGPLPDTITLLVDRNAPCAHYTAGGRYLVLADIDSVVPGRLVTGACDFSWTVSAQRAREMRRELGPPRWTAPPTGMRDLDAEVVRLGTPIPRAQSSTGVAFVVPPQEFVARFEFGDFSGPPGVDLAPVLYPEPGLYHFRVTWTDGTQYQSYLSIRCESTISDGSCYVYRSFLSLR